MGLIFNLWDADEYGDGTTKGKTLTVYPYNNSMTDTSVYLSVPLSDADLERLPEIDDSWHAKGDPLFPVLLQIFVERELDAKVGSVTHA